MTDITPNDDTNVSFHSEPTTLSKAPCVAEQPASQCDVALDHNYSGVAVQTAAFVEPLPQGQRERTKSPSPASDTLNIRSRSNSRDRQVVIYI